MVAGEESNVRSGRKKQDAGIPERRKLQEQYKRASVKYEAAARRVLRRLKKRIAEKGINASVKYRVKSFESYFDKLLRLREAGTPRTLLTDVIGFRIICPFLSDLDDVERIIRADFRVLGVELKGAKHSFREFGYDSTHLMVDLTDEIPQEALPGTKRAGEIQLRTILQDAWAEVEHEVVYKSDYTPLNEPVKRKLASLNATLTLSDVIFQEIRDYQKEVQQLDNRRRTSLEERMLSPDPISLLDSVEKPSLQRQDEEPPIPIQPRSGIDRLIFEALAAHSNNEFLKAIQIYSRVLRMRSNRQVRSVIYNHRGMIYFVLSQYDRAIEDFTSAIRYNSENFRAYNNRALAYRVLQQYERALRDLDRSLEISAIQPEGYYVRALTHFDLQDLSKALQDCERVLNIKPDFVAVQHLKGMIASKITK